MAAERELLYWYGRTQDGEGPFKLADWVRPLWELARQGQWEKVFETFEQGREAEAAQSWPYLNAACPFHDYHYSFLHFAAHQGAPSDVVQRMLDLGAWRSLQNALGERPLDVARKHDHAHLLAALEPRYQRHVPLGVLMKMQEHLHAAMRRWDNLGPKLDQHALRLPQLEPMLEVGQAEFRFDVFFWAGGFNYELVQEGIEAKLVCFGASRVSGGTEGKIEVTPSGVKGVPWR